MDLKSLQKLAIACRKVGIKTYKDSEVEFTLSDADLSAVRSTRRSKKATKDGVSNNSDVPSDDALSEEDMMFWSSAGPAIEGQSQ